MMEDNKLCLHHWVLRERSIGKSYIGICKYCAAEKKFPVEFPSFFADFRRPGKPINAFEEQEETVVLKSKKKGDKVNG